MDRLTNNYTNNDLNNTSYDYDERGNFDTVERYENGIKIDDLHYTYNSNNENQITSVTDGAESS